MKKLISLFFGIIFLAQILVSVPAHAAYCDSVGDGGGRTACHGYFSNAASLAAFSTVYNVVTGGVYPTGVSLVAQGNNFEAIIGGYLNGANSDDAIGAAFIIANMMGKSGTFFDSGTYQNTAGGVSWAKDNFAAWSTIVDQYAAAGKVDFSKLIAFGSAYRNSARFTDITDDAFHEHPAQNIRVIEFLNPDGSVFRIERSCGNLVGDLSPLVSLNNWTAKASSVAYVGSVASPPYVTPTQTVNWLHTITITGGGTASESGWLQWQQKGATAAWTYVNTDTSTAPLEYDYTKSSIPGGSSSDYQQGGPNNTSRSFRIPDNAQDGWKYCQRITFSNLAYDKINTPGNSNSACVIVSVPVSAVLTPNTSGVTDYEVGSGVTLTASHSVQVKPSCDRSLPIPGAPITVQWKIDGTDGGLNSIQTLQYTNCEGSFTTPSVLSTIPGSSLDSKGPGYVFSRTTSIVGGATSASSGTVYEVPFARFFGHDVRVCNTTDNSRFMWDDRLTTPAQSVGKGSFSSLAAIFNDAVSGYKGLQTNTPSTPTNHDTLDASWSPQPNCGPPAIEWPTTVTAGPVNLNNGNSKSYYTPNSAISIGGSLSGQVTINSSSDIYITRNITSSIPTVGASFNPASSTILLVKALNIYITNTVTRVDAVLLATGNVYTCSINAAQVAAANLELPPISGGCRQSLKINGAVSAVGQIHFDRATGSRYTANPSLYAPNFDVPPTSNTDPAEVINYPAFLNFMSLNTKVKSSSGYDTYTILPPRL